MDELYSNEYSTMSEKIVIIKGGNKVFQVHQPSDFLEGKKYYQIFPHILDGVENVMLLDPIIIQKVLNNNTFKCIFHGRASESVILKKHDIVELYNEQKHYTTKPLNCNVIHYDKVFNMLNVCFNFVCFNLFMF